ncbi:hypothetical protein GCM10011611_12990 [Aliidongia dinghuensis]|uniref:Phosphodiester glycosidase domain-containing protein n=1 Tax=Aliidongia dinghuensis TaxID=1867774 RepID=A0A8J2YRC4_9PROT|nr:aspartyl protease family protein [Aliidongia dinghuensis]GGF08919.1 hypothetical protein GCM10011611_12990 [Aliidongia dinghuensis]
MRTFSIRIATVATTFAFLASTAFAADDCALKQIASMSASLIDGALAVDATLNDLPVKMWLATASDVSSIDEAFVKRAGMPLIDMNGKVYSTGRRLMNQKTRISSMRLGNALSSDAPFVIYPEGHDGVDGKPVGTLATDYLSNYDVDIDLAAGKVNLFDRNHCKGQVAYWAKEYLASPIFLSNTGLARRPEMTIVADGQSLRGMISTDDAKNVLRQAVAESRFGLVAGSAEMPKSGTWHDSDGRTTDRYSHTFQSLAFGDITLHNTTVSVESINIAANSESTGSHFISINTQQPDIYIGMDLLKKLHLYIAYSENMIYYTIASPKQAAGQ